MERENYRAVVEWAKKPRQTEASIDYLAEHLGRFLRPREHVLICFQTHGHLPCPICHVSLLDERCRSLLALRL